MKVAVIGSGLVCALALNAQHETHQDFCFDHPKAAVCENREFAGKRQSPPPPAPPPPTVVHGRPGQAPGRVTSNLSNATLAAGAPALPVERSEINFQFADPAGDVLAGFHPSRLVDSSVTRDVLVALGAQRGIRDADMQRVLDQISAVAEAAVSLRNNRFAAALTGPVVSAFAPAAPGPKAVLVSPEVALLGHSDAVNQAVQRVTTNEPLSDWTRRGADRQPASDFWIVGPAELLGPEAVQTGLRRFYATVWARSSLTVDMTFEFDAPPSGDQLRKWQSVLTTAAPYGNTIHWRTTVEEEELRPLLGVIAASSLGQNLSRLVEASRALPAPLAPSQPKPTKPVIVGLQ